MRFPAAAGACLALALLAGSCTTSDTSTVGEPTEPPLEPLPAAELAAESTTTTTTLPQGLVPANSVYQPWGTVEGLTMFRGNPTHTFHGTGPIPDGLEVLWRFPDQAMCGTSRLGGVDKVWCGTGWTGQPVVWERPDGITEVIFGAYDKNVHFLDAASGERTRPDFFMGDIIKGSVTLDPDGYPLLYVGSRDSRFRIIALDRDVPTELWSLDAYSVDGRWNNDWDSSAVIVDDLLLEGGENSWWFAVKLNRKRDETGVVQVQPEVVYQTPSWTDELVQEVGNQHSIESSTAVFGDVAYAATGAGRVLGIDISDLEGDGGEIVFDFWMGDDVDASIVIDEQGMLYVAAEVDLATSRAAEVGQLVKLDPATPEDPLVWSVDIPGTGTVDGGVWATPALAGDVLYVLTNPGEVLAVDTGDGTVLWSDDVGPHAWSSPVVVDETLLVSIDCETNSGFRAYDISDPRNPVMRWESRVTGGCIESTPAVWGGRLFVGSRDGYFYALGAE
ncbi:MAG: PQQ-binding-like beta-propeller repeat protein [Acidimicrobiia bacterium]|nr:PQQ-binding-like beta-propeller repeat protein [Acidimicrobiia bacterium]